MSVVGHKRTSQHVRAMSALPPKADIGTQPCNVRFVPKADSCIAAKSLSFDHVVGEHEEIVRQFVFVNSIFNSCYCLLFPWLPYNTVSEIEKTHRLSGRPRCLSRSRNSLASVGARL